METKYCTKCKTLKLSLDFNKNKSRKDGLQSKCKDCDRKRAKEYFKSSEVQQDKALIRRDKNRKKIQNKICEYLSKNPCVDCKENNILLLEFDHLDPTEKEHNIGQMITNGNKWEKIEYEISKCVIRCLTCHRKRTANQQNNYRLKWLKENNAA